MKTLLPLLIFLLWFPLHASADPCSTRTGDNATVIFPDSVHTMTDGTPIADGSRLTAHTEAGRCAGQMEWKDGAQALTVWGNDVMTAERDGFRSSEPLQFVLTAPGADEGQVLSLTFADRGAPFLTEAVYRSNGIYQVASVEAVPGERFDTRAFDGQSVSNGADQETAGLSPASPSPFNTQASFSLTLDAGQHVHIALYDMLGREVATVHDAPVASGSARFSVDADGLSSGTYFIVARGQDFRDTQRVTVVR